MRSIFVIVISVMFALSTSVSAQNIDLYSNRLEPGLFKDSVIKKIDRVNKYIDSLQIATGEKYIVDSRYPICQICERCNYVITYVMRHNTSIINANYVGDKFVGTSLDVLITHNSKILYLIEITMDLFSTKFPNSSQELTKYDIHAIENIEIEDNDVILDIMICIPDTDIDQYYRIKCKDNNIIEITNVSNKYWEKYDSDDW